MDIDIRTHFHSVTNPDDIYNLKDICLGSCFLSFGVSLFIFLGCVIYSFSPAQASLYSFVFFPWYSFVASFVFILYALYCSKRPHIRCGKKRILSKGLKIRKCLPAGMMLVTLFDVYLNETGAACQVCEFPITPTQWIAEAHCGHVFHPSCLLNHWLWIRWTCPCGTLLGTLEQMRRTLPAFNEVYENRERILLNMNHRRRYSSNRWNPLACCFHSSPKSNSKEFILPQPIPAGEHTCPICLDKICLEKMKKDPGGTYLMREIVIGCDHSFHFDCLREWTVGKMRNDCPVCRAPILYN